jgi:PKD repeat protein
MAPSVDNTSTWSPASIVSVDGHVASRVCLSQCSLAGAPVANFITTPDAICAGATVQFIDHSLQGPTSWSWAFTGGSPATSTVRNPSASFATPGLKGVTLTSTNGSGSDNFFKSILVSNAPVVACANTGTGVSNAGINSFSLNNINNITAGLATDGNKYLDFSCTRNTILSAGTNYTASANVGTTVPSNEFNVVQLFIDYNNDGDFLDLNEAVYSSPSCYIGTHNFSFTTPAVPPVTNQFLRARVIARDCTVGINACYNPTAGQVEDYAVFFAAGTLSVSLLKFEGYHNNGKNILNWETSSEMNNSHFDIERSFDGHSFHIIGRVNGALNSTNNRTYTFTDPLHDAPGQSRFFYRLQSVDVAGRREQSPVVNINIRKPIGGMMVYPNPAKRGEIIYIDIKQAVSNISMYNALGQMVYTSNANQIGTTNIPVSHKWAPGQYLVKIHGVNETFTQKIIIQ